MGKMGVLNGLESEDIMRGPTKIFTWAHEDICMEFMYIESVKKATDMLTFYNLFNANLITLSTAASGSSFNIAATTFCEGACAKPNMVNAATASS